MAFVLEPNNSVIKKLWYTCIFSLSVNRQACENGDDSEQTAPKESTLSLLHSILDNYKWVCGNFRIILVRT